MLVSIALCDSNSLPRSHLFAACFIHSSLLSSGELAIKKITGMKITEIYNYPFHPQPAQKPPACVNVTLTYFE
jgi:hypothetical protein